MTSVTIILFEKKFASNFIVLSTDLFVKDQKTLIISEDYDRTCK